MKILNLKISSPDKNNEYNIVRDVDLGCNELSIIYGNVNRPDDQKASINSLGKSLFLKMVDYILGANNDDNIMKASIHGYLLTALVLYQGKKYIVERKIGRDVILVDKKPYPLQQYKELFQINRSIYDKQVSMTQKVGLINPRSKHPAKQEVADFLYLLKFTNTQKIVLKIFEIQDELDTTKKMLTNIKHIYLETNGAEQIDIDGEIYNTDKKIEMFKMQIDSIHEKIENIQLSTLHQDASDQYYQANRKLKLLLAKINSKKLEQERLAAFVNDSMKSDVKKEHIKVIFEKANQEVPDMVFKRLEEVEAFHKSVVDDRVALLNTKKQELENEIKLLNDESISLSQVTDKLGRILSENKAYKDSLRLLEKYENEMQELKFKEGQLSQMKSLKKRITDLDYELASEFRNAKDSLEEEKEKEKKKSYQDFIYKLVKNIYGENVEAFFDITIRNKHQTTRPLNITLNLDGDTGEGVGEVKKNLIDYLIFNFNTSLELLVQDSSCYNGIDPRQVSNLLHELGRISSEANKQAIVSINKYQVTSEFQIDKHKVLELDEDNTLLGFKF